MITIWSTQD